MTVRPVGVYGGTNINTQKLAVMEGADVIVATPGRFFDLALTGAFKTKHLKKLVIDEVDEMLNLGFRTQLKNILDLDQIRQQAYFGVNFNTKTNLLELLLKGDESMNKVLVFVSTKKLADKLHEKLDPLFPESIGVIHSNKSQNYRLRMVEEFTESKLRVLVATDIIARGLDIAEVSHVVNFEMPDAPADYMHRIGRTGRADKEGIAISFVSEKEDEIFEAIQQLMNIEVPIEPTPDYQLPKMKSKGAFHQKLDKNMKVNRAKEKRQARMAEKKKARRRKKK